MVISHVPLALLSLHELTQDCDEQLFFSATYNPYHVLHRLLPQSKNINYNLRKRTHDLTLPIYGCQCCYETKLCI